MRRITVRLLSLLLAIFFALTALGCGEPGTVTPGSGTASPGEDNGSRTELEDSQPEEIPDLETQEVLIDRDGVRVTFTGVENDDFWGVSLKFLMENEREDKSLTFSFDRMTINGYAVNTLFGTTVAAGKKSNESLSVSDSFFDTSGIISLDEVTFELTVSDTEDWTAEPVCKETLTVHPSGIGADEVRIPARKTFEGEQTVVDNDQMSFLILDTDPDGFWGYTLLVYAENKTDTALSFSWDNVSVNGFMSDPYFGTTLRAGTRGYFQISFLSSSFEENGITEVEEIEFTLRVTDADDWFADPVYREVKTYRP